MSPDQNRDAANVELKQICPGTLARNDPQCAWRCARLRTLQWRASLNENGTDEGQHRLACLVRPGVAEEHDTPLRAPVGWACLHDFARVGNRVARVDRFEPFQLAKAGRGAE